MKKTERKKPSYNIKNVRIKTNQQNGKGVFVAKKKKTLPPGTKMSAALAATL